MPPIPLWVWKLIGAAVVLVAVWVGVQRVRAWHEAYNELPGVERALEAERACEKDSECDRKSAARAAEAATEAALQAQIAVASALQSEEAARKEAAAWRARYRNAEATDPGCAEWSREPVRCPL